MAKDKAQKKKAPEKLDAAVLKRLVRTNWLRTAAWSLRGLLVFWMVWSIWEPC